MIDYIIQNTLNEPVNLFILIYGILVFIISLCYTLTKFLDFITIKKSLNNILNHSHKNPILEAAMYNIGNGEKNSPELFHVRHILYTLLDEESEVNYKTIMFGLIPVLIGSLPSLGILGTLWGLIKEMISMSKYGFSVQSFQANLGLALISTLIALTISIVCSMIHQKGLIYEERLIALKDFSKWYHEIQNVTISNEDNKDTNRRRR